MSMSPNVFADVGASQAELKAAAAGTPLSSQAAAKARMKERQAQKAATAHSARARAGSGRGRRGRVGGVRIAPTVTAGGGTGFTASPGAVVTLASILFIFAYWNDFTKPWIESLMNATPFRPSVSGNMIIGGIVFIIIIGVLSSLSDDIAGVMLLMVIAMWIVFLTFNGEPTISGFFRWFQQGMSANTGKTSTTSTASTKVPSPSINPSAVVHSQSGTTLM